MSGTPFAIQIDEFKPETSPGPSSVILAAPAAAAAAAYARKSDRACDFCRRRKTRCDGAPTPGAKCTNCRRNQCPCTYQEASRPRGPPKAYVMALEDRIERFERLFKRLRPEADFTSILGPPVPRDSWKTDRPESRTGTSKTQQAGPSHSAKTTPSDKAFFTIRGSPQESDWSELSEEEEEFGLDKFSFSNVRLPSEGSSIQQVGKSRPPATTGLKLDCSRSFRYHGKSSPANLVKATRKQREENIGDDNFYDMTKDGDAPLGDVYRIGIVHVPKSRRHMYWSLLPWERAWADKRSAIVCSTDATTSTCGVARPDGLYTFPSADLLYPLLALYFHHQNTVFPLLHGPTFYAQLRDGLHTRCAHFAGVVWAALAVAARWSDDRRVLWDGWGASGEMEGAGGAGQGVDWGSAGWRFFLQSLEGPSYIVTSFDSPSLFDLQYCSLAAMFLRGSSIHPSAWVIIGSGIRKAMDGGAHRKKVYSSMPTVESELWKRAFWMLVVFDRIGSASTGRPICAREEDIDAEFPIEVDDEYWVPADPRQSPFVQPEGKPSSITGFVCLLKLNQIMAQVLRTIYCIDKSKVLLGLDSEDWQEQILSQLNTALDEWVASIPEHLRWRPDIEDPLFANQSANMYGCYYLTLILIYRPFSQMAEYLPPDVHADTAQASSTASNPTASASAGAGASASARRRPFPFPADSICMTAAHSAVRVLESQARRGAANVPLMVNVAQICGATLLLGLHTQAPPAARDAQERARIVQDVERCIACLRLAETRWVMARKYIASFEASLPSRTDSSGQAVKQESGTRTLFNYPEINYGLGSVSSPTKSAVPVSSSDLPSVSSPSSHMSSANITAGPSNFDFAQEQPWMSDAEALQSRADWRWFRTHPPPHVDMQGTTLRHHVPHPLLATPALTPTPTPTDSYPMEQIPRLGGWSGPCNISGTGPAISRLRDEPISSRARAAARGSAAPALNLVPTARSESVSMGARPFLSVASPQSAARDEPGGPVWHHVPQSQLQFPQAPYVSLQQMQQAVAQSPRPLQPPTYSRGM